MNTVIVPRFFIYFNLKISSEGQEEKINLINKKCGVSTIITDNNKMKKKILLLVATALLFFAVTTMAQLPKSYTGAYKVGTANGTATYQYKEDSAGNRIFNGKFTFSGKLIDGKFIETVVGNYKNGLKTGLWVYNTKTIPGINTILDQKLSGVYKEGYPDGIWTINSVTKFVTGTHLSGHSLTGTTISVTGTTSYKNKHLCGLFRLDNKQTGKTIQPYSVQGNFDENGFMDGKWIIRYAAKQNSAITEITRDYKNGVLTYIRELDTQTGATTNTDYSDKLKLFSNYDSIAEVFVSSDNKLFTIDTAIIEGEYGGPESVLSTAFSFFCKKGDHYHFNTDGCLGCSNLKELYFHQIDRTDIAKEAYDKNELKKAARLYNLMRKCKVLDKGTSLDAYTTFTWINCLIGNFKENIEVCKEGIQRANDLREYTDILQSQCDMLKYLGHSYLYNNQYEEAKQYYFESIEEKNKRTRYPLSYYSYIITQMKSDFAVFKSLGFDTPLCDKIINEITQKINEKK